MYVMTFIITWVYSDIAYVQLDICVESTQDLVAMADDSLSIRFSGNHMHLHTVDTRPFLPIFKQAWVRG